ncbi:MAG: hypothetical protein J0L53_15580 [Spirochaetes bacterium]|nr:hypothetical protein [Spirochaetota bacterium]
MKPDHRHETFALAAVVRTVFADYATRGRKIPEHSTAALALVEAWLKGSDVSAKALQAAADLSHQEGVKFEQREKDRSLAWARGAAGNLAWFAKKDRGWEKAGQSVLDAAFYTLSSLNIPDTKDDKALKVIYKAALKEAAKLPVPKETKPVTDINPAPDFTALIGAAAMKRLAKRHPVFKAKARGDKTKLAASLKKVGYPHHACVTAFDAVYGGLVVADAPGEEGYDWLFGAYACLQSGAHKDPRGDKPSWVPIAYSPNDVIFFMDEKGVVWARDTIAETKSARYAASGDAMMKRLLSE